MPSGAIYVGRPTKWGNPRVVNTEQNLTRERVVALYRQALLDGILPVSVVDVQRELRGKDLVCWCRPDQPCHADVLLEIANRQPSSS